MQLASPLPGPSPYSGPTRGLTERPEPEPRPVSPSSRSVFRVRRVPLPSPPASSLPDGPDPESDSLRAASPTITRFLATAVTDPLFESSAASALVAELVDFAAACRLDYATSLVAESASVSVYPQSVGGECALGTDVLEDRQEDFECFADASPHLVSMLLAPEGDPDAPDIPTPRSYAEAIEGPYSSQWQAAMDAEMASWKSTGTYVDEVPPPGANIVSGIWIFRVKRPPGSPLAFKARYVARGFSQRQGVDFFHTFSPTPKMTTLRVLLHVAAQRDYELHSLDFSTAFLQGSLHEEIWLRRPPGFTGSFLAGTQWSLRRPVYGLRQAPREWHDTIRTTLAALGFAPSTADPSLFLRTDATLPPFYVLVYVDDLVFATADTEALAHVKSELQKRHMCTDLGELTSYLGLRITRDRAQRTITLTQSHMVQQVLQRFGFTYSSPQSTPLPTGHSLSAPPSDESVEPSGSYPELVGCLISSCEAEIYAGAMAAQELRWLTYLLTDLGEAPRSPPVLYVDNKAMLALCQEHRLEHRTKHIALRYFLAQELQQHGQLRLAYVASQANTADVFTKALLPSCFAFLDWSCVPLFSPTLPMGFNPFPLFLHTRRHLCDRFSRDLPVLRLHCDKGGEFFSDLLAEICRDEGIHQSFMLPASPQQNGIAEQRIGLIMEDQSGITSGPLTARTSMIHAAAPHFLWPFAVRYAAHQLNLWPRVSLPQTSPTLCWTGQAGDALVFRVWGALSLVHDIVASKLSPRTLRCVFLGFPTDAPPWDFYHQSSCRVFSSQDVTFDES
ncbi:unnamed protein product, partial [Closterium sp. NIES-53]